MATVVIASWLAAGAWLIVSNRGSKITENANGIPTGFGELLAVAILTMILIPGLRRAMRRATWRQD